MVDCSFGGELRGDGVELNTVLHDERLHDDDAEKKAAYDQFGHAAFEGGMGGHRHGGNGDFASAFSDVFDDLFGDFMGGRRGGQRPGGGGRPRGSDLRYNLTISLEEAYRGKTAAITVPGPDDIRGIAIDGEPPRLQVRFRSYGQPPFAITLTDPETLDRWRKVLMLYGEMAVRKETVS